MTAGLNLVEGDDHFFFDSLRAEDHTFPATVSTHPTIDETTVTDNAEYSPEEIDITARIVADPLDPVSGQQIADSGQRRLNEAVERFESFKGVPVQWFSARTGPTDVGVISESSYSIVRELHVDISFSIGIIEVAMKRQVKLPPEVTPKPTAKSEVDTGEQATDETETKSQDKASTYLFQLGRAGRESSDSDTVADSVGSLLQ